jgi:DNA-binding NarL/FixJ family response regulator
MPMPGSLAAAGAEGASSTDNQIITVVVGRLDPHFNVADALSADRRVRVLASDLEEGELERLVVRQAPRVAIVGDAVEHALLVRLQARRSAPRVLVLANDPPPLFEALLVACGASCLARSASSRELLAAIHLAVQDGPHSLRGGDERIERDLLRAQCSLTKREREVFERLRARRSYAWIALDMNISVNTVKAHATDVRRKLLAEQLPSDA